MNDNNGSLSTKQVAGKVLEFVLTSADIRGRFPIKGLSVICSNNEQLTSAYQMLERRGYLSVDGKDVVVSKNGEASCERANVVNLSNIEKQQLVRSGKEAALSGLSKCSNPYEQLSEKSDLWCHGWYQATNQVQEKVVKQGIQEWK